MTRIQKASSRDYGTVATLARTIWQEHYTPIIGADQVEYMLNRYQSKPAIETQVAQGMHYYLLYWDEQAVGYLAFEKRGSLVFLSKIYVLRHYRGKGIGRAGMDFLVKKARQFQCSGITLTVNKYNSNSIKAYEAYGFKNTGALVTDIGEGFVMDDFRMELSLQ